jgi:hypothetical protein
VIAAARDRGVQRRHCRAWQLTGASPSMAYGRWAGVQGAQNEEETEGILTKGFTTKGRPHGELAIAVLPLHGSPQLGGFSGGQFMLGSAQAGSLCSCGALQGLDRAWEAVCYCGGNGARAQFSRWGKVVVGAMGRFFYMSRSPGGRVTMP